MQQDVCLSFLQEKLIQFIFLINNSITLKVQKNSFLGQNFLIH